MDLASYVKSTSTESLVRKVVDRIGLSENNLRDFLNVAFEEVSAAYDLCRDYQARAAKFGEAFEACFKIIMEKLFSDIQLTPDVSLPKACMVMGGEADFAVISGGMLDRKIVAVIEAKGAADHIICNGKRVKLPRPGMLRTDTVKKAICNAYQISRAYPDTLFFIVTSHKPTGGNAKCMCDLAEGDIVDKIVDVTNYVELEEMVNMIRKRLSELG
ncbi:hypothetical protein DRO69_06545 [Candidatus Bathyarchaeota archaeon]|nr:MAG: hypothetical protein DRO69_06545 [Candidatus Bathyarchaeota archaeon]